VDLCTELAWCVVRRDPLPVFFIGAWIRPFAGMAITLSVGLSVDRYSMIRKIMISTHLKISISFSGTLLAMVIGLSNMVGVFSS
jgi:hypothetical protein